MKAQFIAASSLIASAAAAPALQARQTNSTTIPDNTPFGLISIRSGSDVHFSTFSASNGGLALNVADQGATCESETNTATFFLSNGSLFLYTPSNITQELYTDRSGMGQGVLQYSTQPGGYLPGRNSETTGWVVDSTGDLTFDGSSLIACPRSANTTTDSSWSLWVSAGVTNPGGYSNCLGIGARTVEATEPIACTYSYTPVSASS